MMLSGWGRFPQQWCALHQPRSEDELRALLVQGPRIARGNGRGYGDCAMQRNATLEMRGFSRMLAFEAETGQLVAEAGVMLADVIATFLPRGWFVPVTPGTKFVTIGGMVASDVHGKNHHRVGTFGRFVDWIDLMGEDGEVRRCSPQENAELFGWTIGGMGLTGVILRVAFRLRRVESAYIRQTTLPARNLDHVMALFEEHQAATYSVAWIDCLNTGSGLGRSALMLGEHARADELPRDRRAAPFAVPKKRARTIPIDLPRAALGRMTVKAFNALYYRNARAAAGEKLVDWDSYFYPLDAILEWNRIYGSRGFMQFQCVLPLASAHAGLGELLRAITASGQSSFLSVLKRMGAEHGPFSFPLEGYTLALDFPFSQEAARLIERLDAITLDHGGRFYLAKDARMSAATLRRSDHRADAFTVLRHDKGMTNFRSSQSERLCL
ncbi:FAD-binding oxidoreductase [Erythrobacter sanguineus]|uniref:FAD/FMN-containing dehydrogenase n=1 Tax=Erythrobacter sanguineus TaxID=198312 RepID=A0A1M7RV39_9SPHN|nr:FAD-binding oxidoreductase [Erythrobacter sanguineus]SHN49872.1 FAD/FMN-containing dehydrogenase [Erythrobacter sanguineus]